jgi:hypothetical protein
MMASCSLLRRPSGYSQLNTGSSFTPLLLHLAPFFSPVFATFSFTPLFASVTTVFTSLCFNAPFLANRSNTVLATHALGGGRLRDERCGGNHNGRDCEARENSCYSSFEDLAVKQNSTRAQLVPEASHRVPGARVGTAAAVANGVYHATGIRIRELPIRLEKLLPA